MSDQADAPVFGAFSSLLGYVGGQAATSAIFERFLWPQRHFSSFSIYDMPRLACLYSMAGPTGSIALDVIDTAYKNGLFNGAVQGHMLGTHFYRDLEWTYILHARGGESERDRKFETAFGSRQPPIRQPNDTESGKVPLEEKTKPVRARVAVSHIVLSKATEEDLRSPKVPFVSEEIKHVDLLCLVEIILTECVGIGIMICVAAITGSLWSIIFIIPLVLRFISTLFALEREGLTPFPDTVDEEQTRDWEVNCPSIEGKFMLITGPPSIVNQFFQHYGHPVQNRFREVIQLAVVIAFGTYFPVGLLCQVTWMPVFVQYIWTVWQVWQVLAMHFDRYTQRGTSRTTTDAAIAAKLFKNFQTSDSDRVFGSTILFGQGRNGPAVVKAILSLTVADSYADGKKVLKSAVRK
ncbi:hypothetical protein BDP81DRAFT_477770 [Colletotrichum phormii]|uniref:Uncharacterized protein n=1 Tax=Colletotrichum phormii TaxID=359342 RepID=A0AAJ0EMB4_9PEZI|nr:uncharacterized protein BDP81DRAFT_477770 [Colletotrichum phormii]KAK1656417.1 hypothetical protein BDP81DRAFT_477770 [Colletotrichum phormii]